MNLKKTLGISVAALLTLALLVGLGLNSGSGAAAQTVPPANQPVGEENPGGAPASTGAPVVFADGKIKELTATGFTLDAGDRMVNVTVSAETWVVVGGRPAVEGTTASLTVNMGVHVEGTSPAAGQILARIVREFGVNGNPGRPNPPAQLPQEGQNRPNPNAAQLHGTISSVDATGVTVALDGGRTVQFQADATTVVFKQGFVALSALQKGDTVEIVRRPQPAFRGDDVSMASTDAAALTGMPMAAQPKIPIAAVIWVPQANEKFVQGRVEKIEGSTLLVSTRGGLLTVQLADTTTYRRVTTPGQAAERATQADVAVDAPTMIFGTDVAGQERTLAAKAMVVMPVPPAGASRPAPLPEKPTP